MTTATDENFVQSARAARVRIEQARQQLRSAYSELHQADDSLAALSDSLSLFTRPQETAPCREVQAQPRCRGT